MFSSAADVRQYTQIKPRDVGFEEVEELDAWIEDRLVEIADYIEVYCDRTWEPDEVPSGIHGAAREMARNMLMLMVSSRETPVVRIDDWNVRIANPEILTSEIRRVLRLFRRKPRLRLFRVGGLPE